LAITTKKAGEVPFEGKEKNESVVEQPPHSSYSRPHPKIENKLRKNEEKVRASGDLKA